MAMYSRPVPLDPYNPTSPTGGAGGASDDVLRYPSPLVPIRIPVFAPVIFLNDWIVRILSVGTVGSASAGYTVSGREVGAGVRHQRLPSDSVESIEEGEAVELDTIHLRSALRDPGRTRIHGETGSAGRLGRKFD